MFISIQIYIRNLIFIKSDIEYIKGYQNADS